MHGRRKICHSRIRGRILPRNRLLRHHRSPQQIQPPDGPGWLPPDMGTKLWVVGNGLATLQKLVELRPEPLPQRLSRSLREESELRLRPESGRARTIGFLGCCQHEAEGTAANSELVPHRRGSLFPGLWLQHTEPGPDAGRRGRPEGILPGPQRRRPRLPQETGQEKTRRKIGGARSPRREKGRAKEEKEEKEPKGKPPLVLGASQQEPRQGKSRHRAGTDSEL
mmetsp:Transcript_3646/g.8349  ORF Transcript_3646/g.8349 Transcript_3646/m.8349 type:complete len:224 (-) Transcript_3646:99-770(-)